MANRIVLNPVSYHGKGAIEAIVTEVQSRGLKKAFVCSDPDLLRFGVTNKVTKLLDEAGMAYEIYSNIKPNPTIENVQTGVAAYKASGADYMIAIGGGSSMDTAKAIGIIINNPEFADVRSLEGVAPTRNKTVFTIAVPTTAGTAAEVTINYVITDVEKKRKFVCVDVHDIPEVAVVDPDMMSTMPKGLTAATGMDALTHAIEGYITKGAWEMTDMFHLKAIEIIARSLRSAVKGEDEGFAGMALGQYVAGMGFSNVGLGMLSDAIERMTRRIAAILENVAPSIYLYGSAAMDDFRMGWSDVDILVLTKRRIAQEQAERLLTLRQTMLAERPENRLFRAFEGGMLSLEAFESGAEDTVIYWGTSGERIAARYTFDSFCMQELLDCGVLLYGADVRARFSEPRAEELRADVLRHYESIRRFARETGRSFYAYGWLLDISRCIYTLRTGRVIAKTAAGEWALAQRLCPCEGALLRAVIVRRNPQRYQNSRAAMDYAQSLGASVQAYADVLERELARDGGPEPHGAWS